ncbi:MAG: hypothetical protein ACFCVG_09440 [Kineosporiaceae bacterium]
MAAGHQVWSMLVGACVGLAIAMWRAGGRTTGRARVRWRLVGPLLAGWALLWVVTDHAAYNAWNSSPGFTSQ